ncbi:MAG: bifunctional 4-hydroxy-2-oxoglutarate aldolase/2-dehydro-3-deoxy-phosphogluconate aldolase [Bacteroidota bacterium]
MQDNTTFSTQRFDEAPIIGILRGWEVETSLKIAGIFEAAGGYTLEVTMNTPHATEIIPKIQKAFPGLAIGAGTVCSVYDLEAALEAGSRFIVTPILNKEVIKACISANIPIFPGAYTPTEIYRAWDLGASAVKVFPASQLGPRFIKDVLAPLNTIKLIPTGGVTKENIRSFFEAGAVGVGLGGSLVDKTLIQKGDFMGLKRHFRAVMEKIE